MKIISSGKPSVSIILSTYNNPNFLELCLRSCERQTYKFFEVIIADDGSLNSTKNMIDMLRNKLSFDIKHIWHEDKGFRKARILNEAIKEAVGKLLIFTDQDCILPKDFIKKHVEKSTEDNFIIGSRKWVKKEATCFGIKENIISEEYCEKNSKFSPFEQLCRLVFSRFGMGTGCNMSVLRKAIVDINGFNEDFEGYGAEDAELGYRLFKKGIKAKFENNSLYVYHLWHPSLSKYLRINKNDFILAKKIIEKSLNIRCLNGLTKNLNF